MRKFVALVLVVVMSVLVVGCGGSGNSSATQNTDKVLGEVRFKLDELDKKDKNFIMGSIETELRFEDSSELVIKEYSDRYELNYTLKNGGSHVDVSPKLQPGTEESVTEQ